MCAKNNFYFAEKKRKKKVRMKTRGYIYQDGAECRQAVPPKEMINGRVANIAEWIIPGQGGQVQSARTATSTGTTDELKMQICPRQAKGKRMSLPATNADVTRRRHPRISTRGGRIASADICGWINGARWMMSPSFSFRETLVEACRI